MNSRQNEIIELIRNESKTIKQISKLLYIGEMTVRREIKLLEDEGLVVKYRGMVTLNPKESDASYDIRQNLLHKEKAELAKLSASYLEKGQLIFIDGSTTCSNLLSELGKYKPMCVVTNSLNLAIQLSKAGINVKIVPGDVNSFDKCIVGCDAVKYICGYCFDVAFLSAKGISNGKITDDDDAQTYIRRAVIENSKRAVFLLDSSKTDKMYPYVICDSSEVIVITNKNDGFS